MNFTIDSLKAKEPAPIDCIKDVIQTLRLILSVLSKLGQNNQKRK